MRRRSPVEWQQVVGRTGLFDAAWYCQHYPDVAASGSDPLGHYSFYGSAEGRSPNGYLVPDWYRVQADLPADTEPLLHYATQGEADGLSPGPNFDPVWYRTAYRLDAAASPLRHFLEHRWQRTVAPCARLWSVLGLPVVAGADDDDPFLRLIDDPTTMGSLATADRHVLDASGLFDPNHYLLHSADVLEAKLDPLEHFCQFGWQEGRDPNGYFDTLWYLRTNVEAVRLAVNPLVHYLLRGEAADRRPVIYFDPAWYRKAYAIPSGASALAHYLVHRHSRNHAPNALFDPSWYIAAADAPPRGRWDPFTHFLIAGMQDDIRPSSGFDMAAWRQKTRGRATRRFRHLMTPERDNPLVHYLLSTYR